METLQIKNKVPNSSSESSLYDNINYNKRNSKDEQVNVFCVNCILYRRDGVVVRASALQSVDLGFISLVKLYQKTLKNGIYSFPASRSAFRGGCGEQAGKFACCVLGQGT